MRVHTPGDRGAPWVSNFCETNVRTYARDREGRAGIWFLSLDAARLGAVGVARTSYQLPYFWSSMRITGRSQTGMAGRPGTRRSPIPASAGCRARAQPSARCASGPARRTSPPNSGPGSLPDRPVGPVQQAGRAPVLRPRRAPAVAAAPRRGPDRGRRPDYRGGAARSPWQAPGALLARGQRQDRPAGALPRAGRDPPRPARPAARPRSAPPGPGRSSSGRRSAQPPGSASHSSTPGPPGPRRRPRRTSTTPRP